jgi:polyhydroxybutyrate depolymerase
MILAIAPVSGGTRMLPPCRPASPVSVLDVHGTADRIVAYRGRGADRDGRVVDVLAAWARREGCRPRPRARRIDPYVTRLEWPGCREGARVAHLRIEGGGHAWPGSATSNAVAGIVGRTTMSISANDVMWAFFRTHALD